MRSMSKYLDDILWICGSTLIVIGIGMIYMPAALIAAGIALIAAGVMVAKEMNNVIEKPAQ